MNKSNLIITKEIDQEFTLVHISVEDHVDFIKWLNQMNISSFCHSRVMSGADCYSHWHQGRPNYLKIYVETKMLTLIKLRWA